MAYPFLPVNPSCGTVVINDVCGCSSLVNNDPCSTTLTASSTIIYNGPVLSCIVAEPCDTLNVILQKIDEIICNLLSQINILNIQVDNINTQLTSINNEIVSINSTLDVCCSVTSCVGFDLEISGPSDSPGDNEWSALDCYTNEPVGGTITYPNQIRTGCIVESSIILGSKVIIIDTNQCETTTTTTTLI